MKLKIAFLLSLLGGFVALSYEILWVRVYAFATWGKAGAFGLLLGAYLAGIAFGAFGARRYCGAGGRSELRAFALFYLAANVLGFLVIPFVAEQARHVSPYSALVPLGLVAALLGTGFPLVAHFGIESGERVGARLSYLYLANILGSAAGSLLTGFVLIDHLSLQAISVVLALAGLLMSAGIMLLGGVRGPLAIAAAAGVLVLLLAKPLYENVYEKLLFKKEYTSARSFELLIENKSGVIAVDEEGSVYGGGVYDGKFNVDPVDDTNGIVRAYAVGALREPGDVLVVGLGSGSWTQVVAHLPSVRRVTVVEINPGYLELIGSSPVVSSLRKNPKVEFVIDDARRWLARTDRTFDAIVQNTTYHWRAHITNLLSREYLELCRAHLTSGGLLVYNTTWSKDAQATGLEVFPHALMVLNAMIVSDAPLEPDLARWRELLEGFRIDGRAVVADAGKVIEETTWIRRAVIEGVARDARVITDNNMASEWR